MYSALYSYIKYSNPICYKKHNTLEILHLLQEDEY